MVGGSKTLGLLSGESAKLKQAAIIVRSAMKSPRPMETALTADVERLSAALDKAIEQITAHLVHGDVTSEGWQLTLNELVTAQQKQEG